MSFTPPYKYITASELAEKVKQADPQQVQVIDVRDDDFVGGNIVGAKNSPSNAFYDNVKGLVEENKDSEFEVWRGIVVCGCAVVGWLTKLSIEQRRRWYSVCSSSFEWARYEPVLNIYSARYLQTALSLKFEDPSQPEYTLNCRKSFILIASRKS
jgi:rhodanese-related sulfurtransferase